MDFTVALEQAERAWCDPAGWPAWVEGCAAIERTEGSWPQPGASVVWRSGPAGRGTVTERALAWTPGAMLQTQFADDRMRGTQTVGFERLDGGVGVGVELEYELTAARFGSALIDALFVRRAVRDSLGRTLRRFGRELATRRL